ncbi:MAG TPA: hypothetical protein VKZ72_11445, partial [Acidimicrobiales bacterium]|nr:hypothetical protein [Acidimicrobiales bacterium]
MTDRRIGRRLAALVLVVATATTACVLPPRRPGGGHGGPPRFEGEIDLELVTDPSICDPLGGDRCLLPFPNDHFTVADRSTATGRRVQIDPAATPANAAGVHIDPTEINRNDGFSPGAAIAVHLPGIDPERSGLAPITDMGASLRRDAPIVIVDAVTGKRHPYWAELDAGASAPEAQLLFVRPARNFAEGRRYVVGIRGVIDGDGEPIEAGDVFRAYRDRLRTDVPEVEARRSHMEGIFRTLHRAGVERDELVLAWDFTVASSRNLSERLLAMRDDAFARLGDDAPAFTVTRVAPSSREGLATEVEGTF